MNLTKKRWIILIASCVINLCIGSMYAWSVFAAPFAARLSVTQGRAFTAGDLAIVFTVANAVGPVTMITGGAVNDRIGPKWVIFTGGLLFGGGMILSGFAASITLLIVFYGLFIGLAMGMVYGCTVNNSVKFFPDKRGLIGGIAVASYGLSSVLVPPAANSLINAYGIERCVFTLGTVFLIIICGGAFLIQKCPEGFIPDGWTPAVRMAKLEKDKNWREMLRDPICYVMLAALICGAFSGLMTISQASPTARRMIGMTTGEATAAVSVLALFNAAGRVVCGYISDRLGRVNTLTGVLVLAIAGLMLLFTSNEGGVVRFYIGICVTGLCFGSFMGIFPGFTADQFGAKNNSVNYGIMFIGFALAGIFGPLIMSGIYASGGSYQPAFLIAVCFAAAGLILLFTYRALAKRACSK